MSSASLKTILFLQANDLVLYLLLLWLPFFCLLFPILNHCVPDTTYCVEYYTQKDENGASHSSKYKEPHHLRTQQLMESVSPLFTISEITRKTQQTIQIVRFTSARQDLKKKEARTGHANLLCQEHFEECLQWWLSGLSCTVCRGTSSNLTASPSIMRRPGEEGTPKTLEIVLLDSGQNPTPLLSLLWWLVTLVKIVSHCTVAAPSSWNL